MAITFKNFQWCNTLHHSTPTYNLAGLTSHNKIHTIPSPSQTCAYEGRSHR